MEIIEWNIYIYIYLTYPGTAEKMQRNCRAAGSIPARDLAAVVAIFAAVPGQLGLINVCRISTR